MSDNECCAECGDELDWSSAIAYNPNRLGRFCSPRCAAGFLEETTKPSNPKDIIGTATKVPTSYIPIPVLYECGLGMLDGAGKYGRYNWRAVGVRGSVYFDATKRHLDDWWEGEDIDPDSVAQLHHLTKAITSLMVIRDAMIQGKFIDDRPPSSPKGWMEEFNKKVPLILEQNKEKDPKHYTIEDDV